MQYKVCMQNNVMKYLCHHTKMENNDVDISDEQDYPMMKFVTIFAYTSR